MALVINTNVASLVVQRHLAESSELLETAIERLASGLRINHASDDPAGLVAADRLGTEARLANQAIRNANDGLSALAVGDQALAALSDILAQLSDLASASASDLTSDDQRAVLQQQFAGLVAEVDRIAATTQFNGVALLGGAGTLHVQVGLDGTASSQIGFDTVDASSAALGLGGVSVATEGDAQAALASLAAAATSVSRSRGGFGAAESRLQAAIAHLRTLTGNLIAAESRIRDADVAAETAALTRASILQQAAVAILAQANQLPGLALALLR